MSQIKALPVKTKQLLGSTQVITSPCAVIKELVENALDARATSIFVEISSNTTDTLQVRDNGAGIASVDRALVGQRYCTSKIKQFDDIKSIGGCFLGFRGEALASMAELSGSMTVTTRVEGEEVAEVLQVDKGGHVFNRSAASNPVGTTVKILDLYETLPVRKESSTKAAPRTLANIKLLLQKYALARPSIKYSLKILKTRDGKCGWSYTPKSISSLDDAVLKVMGINCATQCQLVAIQSQGFDMEAFVPRKDADCSKISNLGSYISIDLRPVVAKKGVLKEIVMIYKRKLQETNAGFENSKEPLICLNISCPLGCYDPNIEPTKDDVLFEDDGKVLSAVRSLLDKCYPPQNGPATEAIETLPVGNKEHIYQEKPLSQIHRGDMYSGNDEDEAASDDCTMIEFDDKDEENENSDRRIKDVNLSNPWMIAKTNAPARRKQTVQTQSPSSLQEGNNSRVSSGSIGDQVEFPPFAPWTLPTPENSSPTKFESIANQLPLPLDVRGVHYNTQLIPRSFDEADVTDFNQPIDHVPRTSLETPTHTREAYRLNAGVSEVSPSNSSPSARASYGRRRGENMRFSRSTRNPERINKPFVSPVKKSSTGGPSGRVRHHLETQEQRTRPKHRNHNGKETNDIRTMLNLNPGRGQDEGSSTRSRREINTINSDGMSMPHSSIQGLYQSPPPDTPMQNMEVMQNGHDGTPGNCAQDVYHLSSSNQIARIIRTLSITIEELYELALRLQTGEVVDFMGEVVPFAAASPSIGNDTEFDEKTQDAESSNHSVEMETTLINPPVLEEDVEDWRQQLIQFLIDQECNKQLNTDELRAVVDVKGGLMDLQSH